MATLKLKYGVISTDEHIQEAADTWTGRMSKDKYGDDIPHIGDMPDGTQQWFILGKPRGPRIASGGVAVTPQLKVPTRWELVPKNTYVPSERLKAMDLDGVDTHTLFPDIAGLSNGNFQKEGSEDFRLASIQAYNDWLVEEWSDYSPRYISQCISPMWDVNLTTKEIIRSVKKGHKAVIWHGGTELLGFPFFNDPSWDPVYKTCEDLGVPLCLHLGSVPVMSPWPGYGENTSRAMMGARHVTSAAQVIANILYSGVFDRFPNMNAITVESGIGWIPFMLEMADHNYEQMKVWEDGSKSKPSEVWRQHMYANFWFEEAGIETRYHVGIDNILYETDFPHPTSTWPNSKQARETSLKGVPADERRKILIDNPVKLYKLDVDTSELVD